MSGTTLLLEDNMDRSEKFGAWLADYAEKTEFSGNLLISHKGKTIFESSIGYANREQKIPLQMESKFRYYSLSKPFTAIAIMLLWEQGLVDLEAHPSRYLPYTKGLDSRITLRMLLQHTSGLKEITTPEFSEVPGKPDFAAAIAELAKQPLDFAPGTGENYRNTGFVIASLIVEELSGMPFHQFLLENVFKPFGMEGACCELVDASIEGLVTGYEKEDGVIVPGRYLNMTSFMGSAYVVGSVYDLQRFYRAIQEKRLLKSETWESIFTRSEVGQFGLGCIVFSWDGRLTYQNNGGHVGFRTIHRLLPDEDFDIILLSNTAWGDARTDIMNAVHKFYLDGTSADLFQPEMDKGFATK